VSQKNGHILGRRLRLQLVRGPLLLDLTAPHHDDAIRKEESLANVMCNEERRYACFTPKAEELLLQLGASDRVERAEGLIEKQNRLTRRESAGDGSPLPLPTGELVRPSLAENRCIETGRSQRACRTLVSVGHSAEGRYERDIAIDSPVRQQSALLRDVSDRSSENYRIILANVSPSNAHSTCVRFHQAIHAPEQSGLSGSAFADEGDAFSLGD
jgi:hypothetical protein